MFCRLILTLVIAVASADLASANGFFVGGHGAVPAFGGGTSFGHSNYYYHYNYSVPAYQPSVVTYRRVPVYVFVPRKSVAACPCAAAPAVSKKLDVPTSSPSEARSYEADPGTMMEMEKIPQ